MDFVWTTLVSETTNYYQIDSVYIVFLGPLLTTIAFLKGCRSKQSWSDHQHEALVLAQRVLLLSLRPKNLIRPTVICMHNIES